MKIPKIIYSTWISHKPLPVKFNKYIDSWKKFLPEYEIRMITLENTPHNSFIDNFIKNQKYAVAAQYARCQRIFETGGLYFDIDIEVIKSFDELLGFAMFAGIESDGVEHYVNNAIFGTVKNHPFMMECMKYMNNIDIYRKDIEVSTGPLMFTKLMTEKCWMPANNNVYYTESSWNKGVIESKNLHSIQLFNSKYFYPYFYTEQFKPECITKNTYAIHHWAATWVNSVSIIIICTDNGEQLPETIESAVSQTIKPIEVVVVNNCKNISSEAVENIANKYKVKFIDASKGNVTSARNAGIDFAKGRWILNLNAGDIISKEFIERTIDKSDMAGTGNGNFNDSSFFKKEVWEIISGYNESIDEVNANLNFYSKADKKGFIRSVIPQSLFLKKVSLNSDNDERKTGEDI